MRRNPMSLRQRAWWAASAGGLLAIVALAVAGCAAAPLQTVVVTEVVAVEGETVVERLVVEEMTEEPADFSRSSADEPRAAPPATMSNSDRMADMPDSGSAADDGGAEAVAEVADAEGSPLVNALPQERLIIKNGEINILVDNADIAVDRVTQIALDNGGYVLSSQVWFDNGYQMASLTIAVQADLFETAMRRLRDTATQVLSENSSGSDVTSEYVDLESRLANLEATRDRIQTFLDQAKDVDEALEVNEELAAIEAEIEQVKGRMNFLAGRAAFSTILVNIETPKPTATPTPTPTVTPTPTSTPTPTATPTATIWAPGDTLTSAVEAQTGLVRGIVEVAIWFGVVLLPYGLVIGLVVIGGRAIMSRIKQRSEDDESP